MLREPWFLRGRKSVLLRAVLMTVAIAGLSLLAGVSFRLILYAGYVGDLWVSFYVEDFRLVVGGLLGGVTAILVGVPCCYWYGNSRIQAGLMCLILTCVCSGSYRLVPTLDIGLQNLGIDSGSISRDALAMFLALWFAWCVADLQRLQKYPISWSLSAMVVLVIIFVMPVAGAEFAMTPYDILSVRSGGILPRLDLGESTALKATGTLLAILFVPWGIPFWLPPAAQPAETAG